MTINWDEIKKKAQARGAAAEQQVNFQRAVPVAPKPLPKPLPQMPTAVQSRRGNLPSNPTNVLASAFDKEENYIDKAKRGDIGGAAANFIGTGLTGAQTLYLNAANSVDSLAQGKGLPKYQPMMGFSDYDKAVAERRGAVPTIEKVSKINPVLGGIYQMAGEIGTDPLELTPAGYLNDIKLAKGLNQNSQAYMAALQSGKLNPVEVTATLPRANTPAPQPRVLPVVAKNAPVEMPRKSTTTKPLREKPELENLHLGGYQGQNNYILKAYNKDGDVIGSIKYSEYDDIPSVDMIEVPEQYRRKGVGTDLVSALQKRYPDKAIDFGYTTDDGTKLLNKITATKDNPNYSTFKKHIDTAKKDLEDITKRFDEGRPLESDEEDFYRLNSFIEKASRGIEKIPQKIQTVNIPYKNAGKGKPQPLPQAPTRPVQPTLPKKGTEIPKEQMFVKNGDFKSVGADTFKGEKTTDELVKEFGALPKGETPRAREVDIPKKTDYGETQQYARTLQESAIVDDTLFKDINEAITQGSFTKPTKSNKTAIEDANTTLGEGIDEAVTKFKSVLQAEKQPTSYDIALGNRVLQELQKEGRYDEALDVAIDLSEMLSEAGRTLQAARIAKRLSPEGRLMIASRVANKVSKKTGTKVKLSDDTIKLISEAKTEKEVVEANQKAAVEIWNQTPPNWIDKVNSWRYMAMLFNPKTHIRNIVGNSIFVPVREFKNLIGAGLERALIKDGARTKAVLNPVKDKAIMDFASGDFQNVKALLKNEGKLDDHVRNLDAKVFNTKIIEGIRKLNLGALDAEDTWFMKFAYDSSLAQYMKANKLTPDKMVGETLESARKYAMNESLKATYRDFNALANIISKGKHTLASGKYGALGKAGGVALEGMIPFTKTPLNIIKRGVGYSPANVVRGIANLGRVKSGKVTATEAIDQLASGLSGTALLGLGTFLGYNNIVNGKEGEYKDKLYNYNQMLGSQNYSLNIDGKSYTLDWAAPLSMPFFVGVEISNAIKDNNADLATVLDAMTQISDPMVNLSMLKGINDIMTNNFEGIGQTAFDIGTGYAGQFNPTLFGQVARTADDTRRSTISTAETSTGRGIEKFARKQVAKLPIASQKLEPYVDLWGREQKSGNFAENFLSPGYFKSENVTKVDEELKSLVGKLDEETAKKILPTSTAYQYTIKSGGLPYRMTEKESTAYQKTRGQESYKGLNKLFASVQYRKMSEEEKVNAIQDVYSDAHQKAKYNYFDSKGLPVTLALDKNYQEKYKSVKHLVSDKQFYKAVELVQSAGTTDIQKAYAIASLGNANPKLFEAFGINIEAKEGYVPILQKVAALKDSGISADNYITAKEAADINASGSVNKTEAVDYLNGRTDLTDYQKAAILQALVPGLKVKNNPYY